MTHQPNHDELDGLVTFLTQSGLREPALLVLDTLAPLDVLTSQAALFVLPFCNGSQWEHVARTLTQTEAWPALRERLTDQD